MRKHAYQCRNNTSVCFFKLEKLEKIVIVPKIGLEEQKARLIESRR